MMAPLSSSGRLQMALSATVYFMVVLTTCSTLECTLPMVEEMRNRSAFLTKADIKLIQIKCMEDSCHQSNDESKKIDKTYGPIVHQENQPKVQTERCGPVICNETSKCVEYGNEKICVEASTTDARDDLTPSKALPPALVTTHFSDPHATPSPETVLKLLSASSDGDLERVKRILAAGHVDVNSRGLHNQTPTMAAAMEGHRDVVEFLLGRGADVSLVNMFGNNALYLACMNVGDLETVKLILAAGHVDVNSRGQLSQTPTMAAAMEGHNAVVEFLMGRGADVSLVNMFGNNALHLACMNVGDLETVRLILAAGHVDVNSRGQLSQTPVMAAAMEGHRAVVEFLVGRGADVSLVNMFGNNALHVACIKVGDLETVKLILSLNMLNVNAKNKVGRTAAYLARISGHQRVLDLLVSRGGH